MQITKRRGSFMDLYLAAMNLATGDLEEFHKTNPGENPVDVFPKYLDETTTAIVLGPAILAVGGSTGCVWFVTTRAVEALTLAGKLQFFRLLKEHLEEVRKTPTPLTNFVSVDNHAHVRLLDALGATWGPSFLNQWGHEFRPFWL